ncbi:MAG: OB-fold nucleic acid binding domain-containing protein [Beutenbergiaceae bacterium]
MGWRSTLERTLASADALAADEEIVSSALHGAQLAAQVQVGEVVTLSGVLRSVTYAPPGLRPQLVAELFDGSASVDVVWLGRRDINGIEPGTRLVLTGRVAGAERGGRLRIYNPGYTLLPRLRAS